MTHDFTPYFTTLQFLLLPGERIEIAHHFDDVAVGDEVLWGETVAEARRYRVETVSIVVGLQDFWVARCARVYPVLYVAGARLNPPSASLPASHSPALPSRRSPV